MILVKLFAVISAALLVAAVAIGALAPQDMTLQEALSVADHIRLDEFHQWVRLHISSWVWDHPLSALLVRPAWLVPAGLGVVFAGCAMTAANAQKPTPSRRRRS